MGEIVSELRRELDKLKQGRTDQIISEIVGDEDNSEIEEFDPIVDDEKSEQ